MFNSAFESDIYQRASCGGCTSMALAVSVELGGTAWILALSQLKSS